MRLPERFADTIRGAWLGRVSGCMLGKAVELFSMRSGHDALHAYLTDVAALPLRDYVPYHPERAPRELFEPCCRGRLARAEPDDDLNYSVLALMLLEEHGDNLATEDVARAWLKWLPLASTYTAERAAYRILLTRGDEWFPEGREPGFSVTDCADNPYNDWIGAQIRADVYGWVCPGRPELAADLARRDAQLSHRGDGVHGAAFVAAAGACIGGGAPVERAVAAALDLLPADSRAAAAVRAASELAGAADGGDQLRERYADLSVVHTVNNLALVVWALLRHPDDFDAAIGDVVAAGLDTDCNGATVGALWGLQGKPIDARWTNPWRGRVGVSLAGMAEIGVEDLVTRTVRVAERLAA